jgi:hypothetical protein
MSRENCRYCMEIPMLKHPMHMVIHCGAYSVSKRKDGLHWGHYPACKPENCPVIHPELLEGAILERKE